MTKIKNIIARQINDSRQNPTVEVELETDKETFVASCPSGASTGKNEAVALSASQAIKNINEIIAPKLKGKDPAEQKALDALMIKLDGTENKSFLGANAILPVSLAVCRAGAAAEKVSLYQHIAHISGNTVKMPVPSFNFIEGGAHTKGRNTLDLQEFMVVGQKKSFHENFALANAIFANLQEVIAKNYGGGTAMGDEGGFAPDISKAEQALFILKNAIGTDEARIIIDAAASQFFKNGKYVLEGKEYSRSELLEFYKDLVARFPIMAIEDPFSEDDWQGLEELKSALPETVIIGDDLTTTNIKKIKEAENKKACNGVIIKPNQIGTVSEAIEAANMAKSYGWKIIVSHRSGETMDSFIADFAVGIEADYIKSGSPAQPERMVKYSRLLEIEAELK